MRLCSSKIQFGYFCGQHSLKLRALFMYSITVVRSGGELRFVISKILCKHVEHCWATCCMPSHYVPLFPYIMIWDLVLKKSNLWHVVFNFLWSFLDVPDVKWYSWHYIFAFDMIKKTTFFQIKISSILAYQLEYKMISYKKRNILSTLQ